MADLMAIVSKAVFEKEAGKSPAVGTKLGMDRYVSANKNLEPLAEGGRLYLVTVRPPDEKLWLVAVLDKPKFGKGAWVAKPSPIGITDISKLRTKLKFESGKGITAAAGALGMSLQTPRALTAADTALLDAAITGAPAGKPAPADAKLADSSPGMLEGAPAANSGIAPEGDQKTALLAAIIADPGNLDARRVYADILTTHNDRRGEFILLEIALAGRISIRKREELASRHAELKKQYAKTWWPYNGELFTHAGFLSKISGSFANINSAAAKLWAAEPVTDVTITIDEEAVDKLVKARWLPHLRRLTLRSQLGDEGFAAVCQAPGLARLEALNVTANEIGSDGIEALGENLPNVRSLVLTANPIGDEGLAALRSWQALPEVEALYLSGCDLSAEGVSEFLDGLTFPNLRKLCLRNNELGDEIGSVIAGHAKHLPALVHLELIGTEIDAAGVKALTKAKLPLLARIDVRRNDISKSDDPRVRTGR